MSLKNEDVEKRLDGGMMHAKVSFKSLIAMKVL